VEALDPEQHRNALIRRRIKFVVEKGAMARLFRAGTHSQLRAELFERVRPSDIGRLQTRDAYDRWLESIVELPIWAPFSRNGIEQDRSGYIAKLVNIGQRRLPSSRSPAPRATSRCSRRSSPTNQNPSDRRRSTQCDTSTLG
jgi:hypothetical protein